MKSLIVGKKEYLVSFGCPDKKFGSFGDDIVVLGIEKKKLQQLYPGINLDQIFDISSLYLKDSIFRKHYVNIVFKGVN